MDPIPFASTVFQNTEVAFQAARRLPAHPERVKKAIELLILRRMSGKEDVNVLDLRLNKDDDAYLRFMGYSTRFADDSPHIKWIWV